MWLGLIAFGGGFVILAGLAHVRTTAVARAGFAVLRTPPGRAAARKILFGDRSFPDVGDRPPVDVSPALGSSS